MQQQPHPSHHLPPLIIGGAMLAGLLVMAVVLGLAIEDKALYFGIVAGLAVVETVSAAVVIGQMLKHCRCPGCGKTLQRDRQAEGIRFPCEPCGTEWVSRLGGGRRGGESGPM